MKRDRKGPCSVATVCFSKCNVVDGQVDDLSVADVGRKTIVARGRCVEEEVRRIVISIDAAAAFSDVRIRGARRWGAARPFKTIGRRSITEEVQNCRTIWTTAASESSSAAD